MNKDIIPVNTICSTYEVEEWTNNLSEKVGYVVVKYSKYITISSKVFKTRIEAEDFKEGLPNDNGALPPACGKCYSNYLSD